MSQQAKQPIAVNTATTRDGSTTLNTVVTRPVPRTGRQTRDGAETDAAMIPAQAILLGQVTGEPLGAAPQNNEACPVSEPGVADPCGVAGAADAHPAAGGALWALAALPLLGAGGGGGGGGNDQRAFTSALTPQSEIKYYVKTTGDENGVLLADFDSTRTNATFQTVKVVNKNGMEIPISSKVAEGTEPSSISGLDKSTDPWFYLDTRDGKVYLTPAGATSDAVGERYTLTVAAKDGTVSSTTTDLKFTLIDYVLSPDQAKVSHAIDTANDTGNLLANFGIDSIGSDVPGSSYRIVSVTDNNTQNPVTGKAAEDDRPYASYTDNTSDPASDPWFYLDTTSGKVYLTKAGAAAQCIGESFTITVEGQTADGAKDSAVVNFTLGAPQTAKYHLFNAQDTSGLKVVSASNQYDVFEVHQGDAAFTMMQFLPRRHGESAATNSLYIQVDKNFAEIENHFQVGAGNRAIEYLTFLDQGSYYGYDLGTKDDLVYYRVSQTETSLSNTRVDGTACNDLIFGTTNRDFYTEFLYGGDGNDLIFAEPLFTGSPGKWTALTEGLPDELFGGLGHDLLVGGGGDDKLNGGAGNDWLIGGFGKDNLTGGAGADRFVFNASRNVADADTITDFSAAEGDQILLDKLIFGVQTDATARTHLHYDNGTGALSYDGTTFAILNAGLDATAVKNAVFMV